MAEVNPVIQAFRDSQQSAQINASTSFDYDPDKAARAYQLEQQTGVPSNYIFNEGDVDEFENRRKSFAVRDLVRNNPYVEDYVNSHPMAAKMSSDGFGSLDNITQKMEAYHKSSSAPGTFVRSAAKGVLPMVGSLPAIGAGAEVGAGVGFAVGGPVGAAGGGIIGGMVGGLGGSYALSLAQDWLLSKLPSSTLESLGLDPEQARLDLAEHGTASFMGSLAPFLLAMRPGAIPIQELPKDASALARVLNKPISQRLLSGTAMGGFEAGMEAYKGEFDLSHVAMAGAFGAIAAKNTPFGEAAMAAGSRTAERILPFLRSGKEPPVGLDPVVDEIKKQEAKDQIKKLDDLFEAVQQDPTKQRSPDFIRNHFLKLFPDAKIEIDAAAVRKLYGDKQPEKGDNLLGWVPDIEKQMDMAEAAGGRIEVPLDHWLAYADPEVAKQLHDFISTERGAMTLEEAKAPVGEDKELTLPSGDNAVDALRRTAGLDPLFGPPRGWGAAEPASLTLPLPPQADLTPHTFRTFTTRAGNEQEGRAIAVYKGRDAIDHINPDGLRGVSAALYQFFGNRLKETVGDVNIRVVTQKEMDRLFEGLRDGTPGFYFHSTNDIVMSENVVKGGYGEQYAARLIMHEMTHALTTRVIGTDSRVARDILALGKEMKEALFQTDPKAVAKFDYAFTSAHEFIAEAFSNPGFQEALVQLPMSPQLAERLGLKEAKGSIWDALRNIIADMMKKLWGIRPEESMLDGVLKITERIQERVEGEPIYLEPGEGYLAGKQFKFGHEPISGQQPELPEAGTTRMEEMKPFKGFEGLTAKQVAAYTKRVIERREADKEHAATKAVADEARMQTREWKSNEAAMRPKIEQQIRNRPDIAADSLLREGKLGDATLSKKPKIAASSLTPEEIAALPKDWVAKRGGVSADDIAGVFGYPSGSAMVEKLVALQRGLEEGKMRKETYVNKVIDDETRQHMEATYGDLKQNIMDGARDHVLSDVEENWMHEQVQALAEKAKLQFPIKKEELKAAVKEDMKTDTMGRIDSDAYIADAGRAGRKMEAAATSDDWAEAFRQSQAQQLALLRAREAAGYEKKKAQYDKRVDKFYKREVPGMDPSFTNYMHLIMLRVGEDIKRPVADLQKEIQAGAYKNLNSFVDFWSSNAGGKRDLHVPDFLLDPNFSKPVEALTAEEFTQLHNAMTAMEHNGRDLMKIWKEGDKADLGEVLREMVEKIKSIGAPKEYRIDKESSKIMEHVKSYWWSGINVETMLNRIDRNDPHGIMFKTIVNDYTKSSNSKEAMLKEYQDKLSAISIIPDMDRKVDNNLFVDRNTGEYFQMRKRNVLGILQNWGNASNRRKLAEGYGVKPDDIESWLLQNTTKEDWVRAQKIGDLFKELFDKADNMSREISGVGIEGLELTPFTNAHGNFDGWYNPVKYDPIRPGSSKKLLGPEAEIEQSYFRATTNQSYTKGRTEYIAPMELNLDIVPIRMRQMIHDINIRPTIQQLSKIFYDPKFKSAMIAHYGRHQAEMFIPFLNDLANAANFKSMSEYMGTAALEFFRQNTIATLIGFNPSTVLKHGPTAAFNSLTEVGPINFMREFAGMGFVDPSTGMSGWRMAFEKSEQIQRRWRAHFVALIKGQEAELHLSQHSLRDFLIGAGATPVSVSDLLSAVPTWLSAYKTAISKGETEGFSVSLADRAVRRAHGDSALSNKPEIMRTNALGSWFSSLYGFFSHMQQRQYEMAWKAKDLLRDTYGKGSGDAEMATRHAPDLLKGFMSYIIFPAMVEELVTPYLNSEKDSWGMKAAKALTMGLSSSFVGVRDFTRAMVNFRDPQAGIIGTSYKALTDVGHDLSRGGQVFSKEHAGNLIKHTATLTGVLTGLTNAQEGKSAEFLYRYSHGLEKPKGPWGALVGLRYGTIDKHARTFDEWMKHVTR